MNIIRGFKFFVDSLLGLISTYLVTRVSSPLMFICLNVFLCDLGGEYDILYEINYVLRVLKDVILTKYNRNSSSNSLFVVKM